jgi:hypothetical protein
VIEQLLQLLVGIVNTQLFKGVHLQKQYLIGVVNTQLFKGVHLQKQYLNVKEDLE